MNKNKIKKTIFPFLAVIFTVCPFLSMDASTNSPSNTRPFLVAADFRPNQDKINPSPDNDFESPSDVASGIDFGPGPG